MMTLRSFPRGSCDWASLFIACILVEMGYSHAKRKRAFRAKAQGSNHTEGHSWTVLGDFDLDVTADQFPDCKQPVIYARQSPFHQQFNRKPVVEAVDISDYHECAGLLEDFARVKAWARD